jgi:hypothetical protein
MAEFRYPGDDRWQARLRRLIIGSLAAGAFLAGTKRLFGEDVFEKLIAVVGLKDRISFDTNSGFWLLVLAVGVGWLLSGRAPIKSIEFHLFPWFDDETLRPIGPQTGLLAWVDLRDSPTTEARQSLREWLNDDLHDGRWPLKWILRGKPALKDKAFHYLLLLGSNGIGKSQLTREIGRELVAGRLHQKINHAARRTEFWQRLSTWWRRVNPFSRRASDDPWNAGEIVITGDLKERLHTWLPAAPTLLILDDPYSRHASDVIKCLDENSGRFWYSVRLIIVDQFVPQGLDLTRIGANYRDQKDRLVPILALGEIRWNGRQFCAAASGGRWIANSSSGEPTLNLDRDIKAFWNEPQMDMVCEALDGNPLMLAEAAHWLAKKPYRSIHELLKVDTPEGIESDVFTTQNREAYRTQIAHRILIDRVDDLFNSYTDLEKKERLTDHAFIEAMSCAAIAGSVPLKAFPNALGAAPLTEWKMVIPQIATGIDIIPAPGAWPICEAYVERVVADFPQFSLEGLILKAYRANPFGVTRAFGRGGWLATEVVKTIADAERGVNADPNLRRDLFLGAATRAMWSSRNALPQALNLLDDLQKEMLPEALERLGMLGNSANGRVPDTVTALLLLMKLGERRFADNFNFDSTDWTKFRELWKRWLLRPGSDLRYVPTALLDPLKRSYRSLCQRVLRSIQSLNDPHLRFKQSRDFYLFTEAADTREPLIHEWEQDWGSEWGGLTFQADWVAFFETLFRLRSLSLRDDSALRSSTVVNDEIRAIRSDLKSLTPPNAEAAELAFIETAFWAAVGSVATSRSDLRSGEEAAQRADAAAAQFPDCSDVEGRRARTHCHLARLLHDKSAEPFRRGEIAQNIDVIAERFPENSDIRQESAWAWRYAIEETSPDSADRAQTDTIVAHLKSLAERFPRDIGVHKALASAWMALLELASKAPEKAPQTEDISEIVDKIGKRFEDCADIQWSRANSMGTLATLCANDRKRQHETEGLAREVDRISAPFLDHLGLQSSRVAMWDAVAAARRTSGDPPDRVESAALRANSIGSRFIESSYAATRIAQAWSHAAYVWSDCVGESRRTEILARRIDNIARAHPSYADIQLPRAFAWANVAFARLKRDEDPERLEEIARMIDDIANSLPTSDGLQQQRAYAWQYLAFARKRAHDHEYRIQEAINIVREIGNRYPNDPGMASVLRKVDSLLHRSQMTVPFPPQYIVQLPKRE